MLPRVHKHIDGGHQWLSWALGRERALRASGILWAEHKYAMPDGTLVRVQMAGNQSFISLRATASNAPSNWVVTFTSASLTFSDASMCQYATRNISNKPPPPPPPTFLLGYDYEFKAPKYDPIDCNPGSLQCSTAPWSGGNVAYEAARAAGAAALTPLALQYFRLVYGSDFASDNQDWQAPHTRVSVVGCAESPGGGECRLPIPGFLFENSAGPHYEQYIAWDAAMKEIAALNETIADSWAASAEVYTAQTNRLYEIDFENAISLFYTTSRNGRARQVSALISEQNRGLFSQCVSIPALCPGYRPKEQPREPFVVSNVSVGDTVTTASQRIWDGSTSRASAQGTSILSLNASQWPSGEPRHLAAMTTVYDPPGFTLYTVGELPTFRASGFSNLISGSKYLDLNGALHGFSASPLSTYKDWYFSERVTTDFVEDWFGLNFDLIPPGRKGEFFFVFLEFFAYDYECRQWGWLPSVNMQTAVAGVVTHPETREVFRPPEYWIEENFPDSPPANASITTARIRKVISQKINADGSLQEPVAVQCDQYTFNLADFPGVTPGDLRDFIAVAVGTASWAAPADPDIRMFSNTDKPSSFVTGPSGEFQMAIYKKCLPIFGIKIQ